jgi:DNA-binding transcriptional MocR family regulator
VTWHQARAVLDIEGLPPSETLVLIALALRAGNDGRAWPSIARLCADTRLSDSTVRRAIHALAEAGYLIVRRQPGRGLMLTVTVARSPRPDTAVTMTAPARSPRPRPRSPRPESAVTVTGRSNKEEEMKYAPTDTSAQRPAGAANITGGPAPGESWGEYRERGGR